MAEAKMAAPELALDLSTFRARRKVRIDDAEIEMRDVGELTLSENAVLRRLTGQLAAFGELKLDDQQIATLMAQLAAAVNIILPSITCEVLERLSDDQRMQIVAAFMSAPGRPAPGAMAEAGRPTP